MGYSWVIYNELFDYIKHRYSYSPSLSEEYIQGLLNSTYILGAIIGALQASRFLKYSRRALFNIIDLISIVSSFGLYSSNLLVLLVSRVFQGFAAGWNTSLMQIFILEISPKCLLHRTSIKISVLIVGGQVSSFIFGLGLNYSRPAYRNTSPASPNQANP